MRKTVFGVPYEFYWQRNIKMPVKFPFGIFQWGSVCGLQIGSWFFGAVKGDKVND